MTGALRWLPERSRVTFKVPDGSEWEARQVSEDAVTGEPILRVWPVGYEERGVHAYGPVPPADWRAPEHLAGVVFYAQALDKLRPRGPRSTGKGKGTGAR